MRPIDTLYWHCTATPEGREVSVKEIDQWHKANGWKGIGYHKVVHLDGTVSDGRPESEIGAHVQGHNTGSLGYVYVGGLSRDGKTPKDTRTPAQKAAMERISREAVAKYHLKAIKGHRDASPDKDGDGVIEPHEWIKACPCFNAIPEYEHLLKPPVVTPPPPPPPMVDVPFKLPPDYEPPEPSPQKQGWLAALIALILSIFGRKP